MKFGAIVLSLLLAVISGGDSVTAQEAGRDAFYSKFEEYNSDTRQDEIQARLDALAEHLKLNPSLKAIVISYGGKKSCRNEALLRARIVSRYLSETHRVPRNQFTTLNGGYRERWVVELWVGSPGATPPPPAKTINRKLVTISGNCKLKTINAPQ